MGVTPNSGQFEEDYVVSQLYTTLEDIIRRIDALEVGSRATRLPHSSLDTDTGKGYLPIYAGGVERTRIGRMPDGTYTTASVNNPNPPSIPTEPLCIPMLGSVMVAVEELEFDIPYDFSHLNIYCNGLIDGTITRVPGYWIVGPLDPSTTHTFAVTAVNQSGKESLKSQTVIAQPLSVVDEIDLGSIKNTMIEDGAISTPKLAALAVVAAKIAANAIESTHVKAGSITADKIAAMIIMAQKRFICGNPVGRRVEINEFGIEQRNEFNQVLMQLGGSTDVKSNFLTIPNPEDPYDFLATLDEKGILAVNGLSVWGDPNIYGVPLSDILDRGPRGLLAYGEANLDDNNGLFLSNSGSPLFELAAVVEDNRIIRVAMDGTVYCENIQGLVVRIHFTTDGSKPTLNSPIIGYNVYSPSVYNPFPHQTPQPTYYATTGSEFGAQATHFHGIPWPSTRTMGGTEANFITGEPGDGPKLLRILFSGVAKYSNFTTQFLQSSGKAQFKIEDLGRKVPATGNRLENGVSNPPIPARKQLSFTANAHKMWRSNALGTPLTGDITNFYRQGGDPNSYYITKFKFDNAQIIAALGSGVIEKVELFLYCGSSDLSDGGTACIYPSSNFNNNIFSGQDINEKLVQFARPEGKWVEIPLEIGERIRQSLSDSIVLFPGKFRQASPDYLDPKYNMIFASHTDMDTSRRPKIRYTFRSNI